MSNTHTRALTHFIHHHSYLICSTYFPHSTRACGQTHGEPELFGEVSKSEDAVFSEGALFAGYEFCEQNFAYGVLPPYH